MYYYYFVFKTSIYILSPFLFSLFILAGTIRPLLQMSEDDCSSFFCIFPVLPPANPIPTSPSLSYPDIWPWWYFYIASLALATVRANDIVPERYYLLILKTVGPLREEVLSPPSGLMQGKEQSLLGLCNVFLYRKKSFTMVNDTNIQYLTPWNWILLLRQL